LDPAVRTAGDDESRRVDEVQVLYVVETRELIVELLGLEKMDGKLIRCRCSFRPASLVDLIRDVRPFGIAVTATHRREHDIARRHEDAGDRVELRTRARVFLTAVIPDERGKRTGTLGLVEKADEIERAALERDALLVERRGGLLCDDGNADREQDEGSYEQRGCRSPRHVGLRYFNAGTFRAFVACSNA
jgi:hypothetical protein